MRLPLSYQTALPDDFEGNAAFHSLLATLHELGFWGVELNMSDPAAVSTRALHGLLDRYGLELSMLATGLTAKRMQLSLSAADKEIRARSVAKCRQMIDWAAEASAGRLAPTGVILGFLKGGVAADPAEARACFRGSLEEVLPHAARRSVAVLVEATNRYESSVANSLGDAAALITGFPPAHAQILPDTFHMNIEEADMLESLRVNSDRFTSLHLSDNNRLFPGFGAIDFEQLFGFLEGIGYMGRLAIEGNVRASAEADLRASLALIGPLLEV